MQCVSLFILTTLILHNIHTIRIQVDRDLIAFERSCMNMSIGNNKLDTR